MPCFQHVNSWPNIKFRTTGCERKHPERAVRLSPGTSHGHISWMDRLLADSDVLKTCIKDSIMGLFSFILALFYFHFKRKAVSLSCYSVPPAKGKMCMTHFILRPPFRWFVRIKAKQYNSKTDYCSQNHEAKTWHSSD